MDEIPEIKEILNKIKITSPNARIMSLDVGSKKIGVALSCHNLSISLPHCVIIRQNFRQIESEISKIIQTNHICLMVVGLPLQMDGAESQECYNIRKFIEKLHQTIKIPHFFQDERLSTKMANQFLTISEISRKKSSLIDDQIAASLILESFLNKLHGK